MENSSENEDKLPAQSLNLVESTPHNVDLGYKVDHSSDWMHLVRFSILTAVGIILFAVIQWIFSTNKADEWGQHLRYFPTGKSNSELVDESDYLDTYFTNFEEATTAQKQRVREQLEIVKSRAKTHIRATRDLYVWSSVTVTVTSLTSVLTALCLLHITRRGWDNSNPRVVGIFVISAGTSVLCASLLVLYQYDVNIRSNANLYIRHINLEEEMLTILATEGKSGVSSDTNQQADDDFEGASGGSSDMDQQVDDNYSQVTTLREIIIRNNQILRQYNTVSLELNLKSIPSLDQILDEKRLPN